MISAWVKIRGLGQNICKVSLSKSFSTNFYVFVEVVLSNKFWFPLCFFWRKKLLKTIFCFPKYFDVNVYFATDLLLVVLLMVSGGAGLGRVGLKWKMYRAGQAGVDFFFGSGAGQAVHPGPNVMFLCYLSQNPVTVLEKDIQNRPTNISMATILVQDRRRNNGRCALSLFIAAICVSHWLWEINITTRCIKSYCNCLHTFPSDFDQRLVEV